MSKDVTAKVVELICDHIVGDRSKRKVSADTPLLSHGLDLDSVAVLELIMVVETEFGVRFDESDLSIDLFKTAGALAEVVARKISTDGTSLKD